MRHMPYAFILESLIYVMKSTRPNIYYDVGIVCSYQPKPGLKSLGKRILNYLQKIRGYMLVYLAGNLIPLKHTNFNF